MAYGYFEHGLLRGRRLRRDENGGYYGGGYAGYPGGGYGRGGRTPGGLGGPYPGLGVDQAGTRTTGMGMGSNPGGLGGPASGLGVRPGLGVGGLGRGR